MSAAIVATSRLTRRLLAPNPGPMTLDGTNSYLLAAPGGAASVVVDPGPLDEAHLQALAATPVELILVTHRHADHTAGSARLAALTGAPVRALDPAHCFGGEPLRDGEQLTAAGVDIRVVATPGHTADSVCFLLGNDAPLDTAASGSAAIGAVLTGDTILGRGSTVIAHPDSTLAEYLDSLDTLAAIGPALVLPGHGPVLPSLAEICAQYREHRMQRLDEVRAALAVLEGELGGAPALHEPFVARITAIVYPDVDAHVLPAAEASVRAQLVYLLD
ncbi:glyoxylase-like metal-dependent hydrolase (beta-lactamase superfamily II) [Microterricola gilva]|uniref:Glyoxylase-like metal-dependent hydrolase (Beta-lactamase superfamily II) n=1 Tax=Microterricola gilva TaxID=393267 RepID=A0A4Q8AP20_9MICO|nr:MBL fold metallo-hydrolase [Microterricola gilva]RZU66384.1 glyoxylase-like metal-dependent hydrolase (beta-lactamase superfamily II) [Microterricola gilva]